MLLDPRPDLHDALSDAQSVFFLRMVLSSRYLGTDVFSLDL